MSDNKPINAEADQSIEADQSLNASLWLLRTELQKIKAPVDGEDKLRLAWQRSRPVVVPQVSTPQLCALQLCALQLCAQRWPRAIAAGLLITLGTALGTVFGPRLVQTLDSPVPDVSTVQSQVTPDAVMPVYQAIPYPGSRVQPAQMEGGLTLLRVRLPVLAQDSRTGQAQPLWIEADVLVGADGLARAIRTDNVARADHVLPTHVMEKYQ